MTDVRTLAAALGLAQLIAWGTLYYAVAVLAAPMQRDLGLSSMELYGLFSWSLALSGLLAPWAGRALDRMGGRVVLATGAILGALGFGLLGVSRSPWMLGVGWTVQGVAMALALYDTCFAAIGQTAPRAYRKVVTAITLIAGLASSVFWPVSHYLEATCGWRTTCLLFAGLLLACVPIYARVLPSAGSALPSAAERRPEPMGQAVREGARILSLAFAAAGMVSATLSAHLVSTLQDLRFSAEHAVWIASSIGVMQVLGRVTELRGTTLSAHRLGTVTFAGLTTSLLFLLGAELAPILVVLFAISYGAANGLMTIVKAVLPVELFGTRDLGALLGSFSAPSLVTRALAPWAFAALQATAIGTKGSLVIAIGVAAAALGAFLLGVRRCARSGASLAAKFSA